MSVKYKFITNTTKPHMGRFGNQFFINMACNFIAKKNNLKFEYANYNLFHKLGIDLFISGKNNYDACINLLDNNFFDIIISPNELRKNISIRNNVWCQTKEFSLYLKEYFNQDIHKNKILNNNLFKERYNINNDVYIHVRLGDIVSNKLYTNYEYYDKALSNIVFDKGYISSDSINHDICQKLINKYNLEIINKDEVETIMFASTCKYLVLSNGTFSWLIGLLGYYSTIYYPLIKTKWHGDIFVFPEWNEGGYP